MTPDLTVSALDAIYNRRATRAFTNAPIAEATIRELLRAAVHAPTAMHLEPWAFVVIQDRTLLSKISVRAKALIAGATAASHAELARAVHAPSRPALFTDPSFDIFYGAGTLIVICGKPMGMFAAADCWLAAENLMIAATAYGLATCPIGFAAPALAEPELKVELAIPADVTPIAAIIVGVPAVPPAAGIRRDPEILSWKR